MKALLISESKDILNSFSDFFEEAGYETVCYRWLLKAMDNLEEIAPQLVFIDGADYPRHWKILVQHIRSGLYHSLPLIFLAAEHISDDEAKKAEYLEVYCIRTPIRDEQTREKINLILHPSFTRKEPQIAEAPCERKDTDDGFVFFHPTSKTAIQGTLTGFEPPILYFKPDDEALTKSLRFGQKSTGIIKENGICSNVSVQIQGLENGVAELCILK